MEFLARLVDTADFPARWTCGRWTAAHGWLHVASDLATWGAYTAIPLVLIYFVRRRDDIPFTRIFWLFGLFIFSCGTVHLIEAGIFWWPAYRLLGMVKLITAIVSWATVIALIPVIPKALGLPGLARVNARLEKEIDERERAQQQLRAFAHELEQSNDDLRQFAYVASHDLQEPLRTMNGFCQVLEQRYGDRLDDDGRRYLRYVSAGAGRMQAMIRELLTYSRVRTDLPSMNVCDTSELVQQTLADLDSSIDEARASIEVGPLPVVRANSPQLSQVFHNLLGNALKYRSGEAPSIRVFAERKGADWEFSVEDDGVGIAETERERVFEIFQRGGNVDAPGTGVGLAICRKVVTMHGGRIWIEPRNERGTRVSFTIPVEPETSAPRGVARPTPRLHDV